MAIGLEARCRSRAPAPAGRSQKRRVPPREPHPLDNGRAVNPRRPARATHPEILQALRRARDLTDRDFAQPLTLDAMAAAARLSKFHFARAFASAYGETPRTYLTRRRVERAKDLLRAANLTITEICFCVGFESVGSFSARFKELVGTSPTGYRRSAAGAPPIPGCFVLMWTRPPAPTRMRNPEEAPPAGAR